MRLAIMATLAAITIAACGGSDPEPTPTPEATATSAPTEQPTPTPDLNAGIEATRTAAASRQRTATASVPTPAATATIAPELLFAAWKTVFWSNVEDLYRNQVAEALEAHYWIDSIDRIAYDEDSNTVRVDATVAFESVYLRDPQDWRDNAWELFRLYGRSVWGPLVDGTIQSGMDYADWETWTPALLLYGNTGRLTASCPGSLIHGIHERRVTQTEFEAQCTFSH